MIYTQAAMVSQKPNTNSTLTKMDRWLIAGGFVATTLLAWYLAGVLFEGHPVVLMIEVAIYLVILVIYGLTLRSHGASYSLLVLSRTISIAGIATSTLVALFVAYFIMTFRW